jgi:hypothetical protein
MALARSSLSLFGRATQGLCPKELRGILPDPYCPSIGSFTVITPTRRCGVHANYIHLCTVHTVGGQYVRCVCAGIRESEIEIAPYSSGMSARYMYMEEFERSTNMCASAFEDARL